jgi:hypothetical protein
LSATVKLTGPLDAPAHAVEIEGGVPDIVGAVLVDKVGVDVERSVPVNVHTFITKPVSGLVNSNVYVPEAVEGKFTL